MFSNREKDVLKRLNFTDKEIGTKLGISPLTVKCHLVHIMEKLNVSSRANAVLAALKGQYISLEDIEIDFTKEKECEL